MDAAVPWALLPLPLLLPVPVPPLLNRLRRRSLFEVVLDAAGDVIAVCLRRARVYAVIILLRHLPACFPQGAEWIKGASPGPSAKQGACRLPARARPRALPLPLSIDYHWIADAVCASEDTRGATPAPLSTTTLTLDNSLSNVDAVLSIIENAATSAVGDAKTQEAL